jgi:hypothetical protein
MKPAVLFLLLLSACEIKAARNYRTYKLTWSCLSAKACERTEQVMLIDRAELFDNDDEYIGFLSSRDDVFRAAGQRVPSDDLPADCAWMYGLGLFAHELEPSRFCRTSGGFELELSIPDRDPTTHSEWLVEGRQIEP